MWVLFLNRKKEDYHKIVLDLYQLIAVVENYFHQSKNDNKIFLNKNIIS
jgi:hypothetical protein